MEQALQIAVLFREAGVVVLQPFGQVQRADGVTASRDRAHVNDILQFPDISRPGVGFQGALGVFGDFQPFAGCVQEKLRQGDNILNPVAQRGDDDTELG